MSAPDLLDRLLAGTEANGAAGLAERRRHGRSWLDENGLPTSREEAWRYTDLARLTGDRLDRLHSEPAGPSVGEISASTVDELAGAHGGPRIVFVNGVWSPDLSDLSTVPTGVAVTSLAAAEAADVDEPDTRLDGFVALNQAAATDGATVRFDPAADVMLPIHVVHLSTPVADQAAVHPATHIEVAAGARATVIESWVGTAGPVLVNGATSIEVADRANLTYYRVQADHPESVHLGATTVTVGESASFTSALVSTGADVARTALDVTLAGDHAVATLDGLYAPVGDQHHDNVITVQHSASKGRSHQRFRGIIDDRARGSFTGQIIVDADTAGTDAEQSNHSLLLTSRAESDTRPWLEIHADDVQCSHGATVGRLDDAALFYLRSRGIPTDKAREMLIDAFAAATTEAIEIESLREHVAATVASRRSLNRKEP